MRILVDYRPALRARTGVGEYMHQLIRAYTSVHADTVSVFTSSWKDRAEPGLASELGATVVDRRVPVSLLNLLWHRLEWPPIEALAGAVDVAHAAHPLLIPARRAAQVVTIHDLFFLSNAARTRAEIRRDYPRLTADHARRADAVVTPSHHVKEQVVEQLGVAPDRIYPCPPGSPLVAAARQNERARGGHILFVGTLEPRKNVGALLDAYTRLLQRQGTPPPLVLVGRATAEAGPWLARVHAAPLRDHVSHLGYVGTGERERLYSQARVLVLPSWDEGFGLPVLEAMAAGVPVIASRRGALPEVLGTVGALIEPDDIESLTTALHRATTDPVWSAAQSAAGLARAAAFSWQASAATLRRAYADAAARRQERA